MLQVPAKTCDTEAGACYAISDRHCPKQNRPGGAAKLQRKAGIKAGDRLEFKASRGLMTIAAKSNGAEDKYTSNQRRMVDREIIRGLEDIKRGRVHGPFTVSEATKFITAELKTRTKKRKPK